MITSPTWFVPVASDVFTTSIDGFWSKVTVSVSSSVTSPPLGLVPVASAVFSREPASRSACVTVCCNVPVVDSPGANVVTPNVTGPSRSSSTVTPVKVTSPVLVTL